MCIRDSIIPNPPDKNFHCPLCGVADWIFGKVCIDDSKLPAYFLAEDYLAPIFGYRCDECGYLVLKVDSIQISADKYEEYKSKAQQGAQPDAGTGGKLTP